jgi:hypothetical protein
MACAGCEDFCHREKIASAGQLQRILAITHERLANGSFHEAAVPDGVASFSPIAGLPVEGPWPDLVQSELKCASCGQRFVLSVETYHGTGGHWAPVPSLVRNRAP